MPLLTRQVAGWLLLFAMLSVLVNQLAFDGYSLLAGLSIWIYFVLCFPRLTRRQKKQTGIIMGIGLLFLLFVFANSPDRALLKPLINANQLIITLVGAVTFLKLIASLEKSTDNFRGKHAVSTTLFGTHLISSVINISAVMLVAEKIKRDERLTLSQALLLSRAFGTAAHWSPFFAAMGVTLLSAKDATLGTIILYTLPIALLSLFITWWQLTHQPDTDQFEGYPIGAKSLQLPLALAGLVLLAHHWFPAISVIMLISLISLLITVLSLLFKQGAKESAVRLNQHVCEGLPNSAGEVSLFLSSSVLATGISALLIHLNLDIIPESFGFTEASITLVILIALAFIGVHPVTSNLIAGGLLVPIATDHNLLAITLLFAWALGVVLSPLSGLQILLQGRYQISARDLLVKNRYYAPVMIAACIGMIALYTA